MNNSVSFLAFGLTLLLTFHSPVVAAASSDSGSLESTLSSAATYKPGQTLEPFRRLEEMVRESIADAGMRGEIEKGLIRLLRPEATFEARRFACIQLGIIGSEAALPSLGEMLQDEKTTGIACLGLTTYPAGKADELLRKALKSARGSARLQIINTLGDRRDAKAVKALAKLGLDSDRLTAASAIAALGKIGDRAARRQIESLRKKAPPELRAAVTEAGLRCVESLASAGDFKDAVTAYQQFLAAEDPTYVRRSALDALLRMELRLDPASVEKALGRGQIPGESRITAILKGSDAELKPVAIAAIRSLRTPGVTERFSAFFPSSTPEEQVWFIQSFAVRGDSAARTVIHGALASEYPQVRRAAVVALAEMGDSSSVPGLVTLLSSAKELEERRAVESTLVSLPGGPQTTQALMGMIRRSSGELRGQLITALGRREGAAVNRLLLAEAAGADVEAAKAALQALSRTVGAGEAPMLIQLVVAARDDELRREAQSAARAALLKMDSSATRSALVCGAMGYASQPGAKAALFGLLSTCGDSQAFAGAKNAAADSRPEVREAAVRALADWPDLSAWETLLPIYRQKQNRELSSIARQGLVRLLEENNATPNPALLEHYGEVLAEAESAADLRLVLGALGGVAHPEALQLALPLLSRAAVRSEAEAAVKRIAEAIKAQHPQAAREALDKIGR